MEIVVTIDHKPDVALGGNTGKRQINVLNEPQREQFSVSLAPGARCPYVCAGQERVFLGEVLRNQIGIKRWQDDTIRIPVPINRFSQAY